jgi:uncharacterized membrane protein
MNWPEALTGAAAILLFAAIMVVLIVQVGATWRARMSVAREDAYRRLAEQATAAEQESARRLGQVETELTAVRTQTNELRRLLREVEEPWKQ